MAGSANRSCTPLPCGDSHLATGFRAGFQELCANIQPRLWDFRAARLRLCRHNQRTIADISNHAGRFARHASPIAMGKASLHEADVARVCGGKETRNIAAARRASDKRPRIPAASIHPAMLGVLPSDVHPTHQEMNVRHFAGSKAVPPGQNSMVLVRMKPRDHCNEKSVIRNTQFSAH